MCRKTTAVRPRLIVLLKVANYAEINVKVPRFPNYAHEFLLLGSGKNFQKHFANKCQDFRLMLNDVPFSFNSQLPWNEDQGVESCILQLSWVRREFWAMFRSR